MTELRCFRCRRKSYASSNIVFQGVNLGPTCFDVLQRRRTLRGSGENSKLHQSSETGYTIPSSSFSEKYCPADNCIECPHFPDKYCPLEIGLGYTNK